MVCYVCGVQDQLKIVPSVPVTGGSKPQHEQSIEHATNPTLKSDFNSILTTSKGTEDLSNVRGFSRNSGCTFCLCPGLRIAALA